MGKTLPFYQVEKKVMDTIKEREKKHRDRETKRDRK